MAEMNRAAEERVQAEKDAERRKPPWKAPVKM